MNFFYSNILFLGLGNNSQEDKSAGDNNGTGSACNTLSSNKGTNNSGSGAVVTMNHINATASGSNAPGITTSSDTFNLVWRRANLSYYSTLSMK